MRIFGYLSKEYGSAKFIAYSLVLALLVLIWQPAAFALTPNVVWEGELHNKWVSHPYGPGDTRPRAAASANSFYLVGAPAGLTVNGFSSGDRLIPGTQRSFYSPQIIRIMNIRFGWTGDISANTTFQVFARRSGSDRLFDRSSSTDLLLGTITIRPVIKELRISTPTNRSSLSEGCDSDICPGSGSTTSIFTVRLGAAPSGTVTVAVSSTDTTAGTVSPSTLTFTKENFSVAQTVTAYSVRDYVHDETQRWNVLLNPASTADDGYNGLSNVYVPMSTENSPPNVALLVTLPYIFEDGSNVVNVTARMDSVVTHAATTIIVGALPGSGTSETDFKLSSKPVLTIPAGERTSTGQVTITAVDNNAVGADKFVTVWGTASNSFVPPNIWVGNTTLRIYDDESRDGSLSNLVLSAGQLSPAFSSSTLRYTATVDPSVESLTVTPTSSSAVTDIRVNDESVSSGEASDSIELVLGENTITVLVVPRISGHRQEYQILVTRGESTDRTPDEFSFAAQNNANPGSWVTSEAITVAGLGDDLSAEILVSAAGHSRIRSILYVDGRVADGRNTRVTNGQQVAVRVLSSDEFGGTATATVTIGGVSADFTVTTRGDPAPPDAFSFAAVNGVEPGSRVTSDAVTISGLDEGVEATISVSGGTLVVSDSDSKTTVTNDATTVTNGQQITVSVVASDVTGGTTTATVTIGNASANFTVTTRGTSSTDQTPDAFSFAPRNSVEPGSRVTSDAVTVSGLGEGVAAAISVSDGASLLVNDSEFTGASVTNGQRVAVSVVASREFGGTATATVTIGGVSGAFTATTRGTSSNADLGSLSFSPAARLSPSFSGGTVSYTASVSDQLSTITILATPAHSDASVSITPADAQASTSGHQVNLITGLGTATIVVTAEDNRTRKTYTVRFTPLETAPAPVIEELEEEIVTEVSREVTSNTLQAITGRIGSAVGNVPAPVAPPTVGGLLPVLKIFDQHSRDSSSTRSTLHQSLDGANFVLSLTEGSAGQDGGESPGGAAIWGSADYRNMSGGKNSTVNWDGELFSVHVGTDTLLESGLLVGLSASVSRGTFDYFGGQSSTRGQLKTRMTSLYPYLGWTVSERLNLWMTAGYGQGRIEYNNETYLPFANDTSLATAAFGSRYRLSSDERNMPGDSIMVDLKTEAWGTRLTVKGNEARPAKSSIRTHGVRLAIEGSRERNMETGATVMPFGELGVRWDGGDGETGTGVEVGGGLKLLTSCRCMTVDAGARILATHESGRKEWGANLSVRRDLSSDRTGMSYGASLSHGEIGSKTESLWESSAAGRVKETDRLTTRLAAEIGYGLYGADGIYTPYAGLGLTDYGSRDYSIGVRYAGEAAMSLGLEFNRLEKTDKSPDHRIMLTGQMDW